MKRITSWCSAVSIVVLMLSMEVQALSVGESLAPLAIKSHPVDFSYKPDGLHHLILVYPLKLTSWQVKKFHRKVMAAGYCPQSIVNMTERGWYAPLSIAEKELASEMKASDNPSCSVTADYNGTASTHWGLAEGAVSIVVDGDGKVAFLAYGVLDEKQEAQVMDLLAADGEERLAANSPK